MTVPKITLYLDIVSPFAYMAFDILRNSPVFSTCDVTFIPIFLGGLMKTCGNTAPVYIKNKDRWVDKERHRWAQYFSIPMSERLPSGFPPLTLATQRALCAISANSPDKLIPAADALFRSLWVEGNEKIGQPEGFMPVLEKILGKTHAQEILAAANQPEAKSLLVSNTDRAFKSGAFGLPWVECTNLKGDTESFWGVDHLGQAADFLGLARSLEKGFRVML